MINLTLYSVTSLNRYIKQLFDNDFSLRGLKLKGEISNYKPYSNGHIYFTLKDDSSSIKAVMFNEYTRFLPKDIKDGDEVIVTGYVSTYPARGEYQFYAQAMELSGEGALLLEFEMLKKKLASEGLFDESKKKPIPVFPKSIGIISAPNSAALADIKTNLLRRNPLVDLKVFPSLVQGADAPRSLLKALKEAENSGIDTLIIGRGGGANEDLSAFNDEALVREAFKCEIPIISAVGHEIDFTLIDFVADARASTPTGAAELATIDKREIYQSLDSASESLDYCVNKRIERIKQRIELIKSRPFFINPKSMYENTLIELNNTNKRIDLAINHLIERDKNIVASKWAQLKALSPDNVISRGYAIILNKDNKAIKSIEQINTNDLIKTRFKDGIITSHVVSKEKTNG